MKPHLIKTALRNLHSTTLRTLLAMLGILVGTAAVVAMVSTGQMATEEALAEFKGLGTDLLAVSLSNRSDSQNATGRKNFDIADIENLRTSAKNIDLIAPYVMVFGPISYNGKSLEGGIIGTTASLASVIHIQMLQGRFITPLDHYEKYCVIGYRLYQKIKSVTQNDVMDTQINLGTQIFTIIGVAALWPENAFFYQDINNSVIVPLMGTKFFSKQTEINNLIMRLKPETNIAVLKNEIETFLQKNAPEKELFIRSAKELIKSMAAQHKIFTLLLSLIGSISLLVGGIGVMNIMLVSVLERKREIGIRLALGAQRKEIQWMFLTEAILLSVIGGSLGIIVGIIVSLIIATFAHWHFAIFLLPPLIGFSVSALIGIFFGYYPAHAAAKLDPIETLRSE